MCVPSRTTTVPSASASISRLAPFPISSKPLPLFRTASSCAALLSRRLYSSKPPARHDPFRPPQFPDDPTPAASSSDSTGSEVAPDADLDGRVRFVQWQQARLSDEIEQLRRAQAYDAYTRRRFWILLIIFLLCLELFLPFLYYINTEEMDPDDIPDHYLGLWLHEDEPHVYLRINEDGRVTYERPDKRQSMRGQMRKLTPKSLQVNVWSSAVFDALPLDGPPVRGAEGRLVLTVDGVKLTRQHASLRRSPDAFLGRRVIADLSPLLTTAASASSS